ncbi:hypothetical protein ACFL67_03905 [candidate division KSB1 bacterium]
MPENFLFFIVFSSQIFLLSIYKPRKLYKLITEVWSKHPPSEYPRFYPRPVDYYDKWLRWYRILNICSFLAVLTTVAARLAYVQSGKWDGLMVGICFLIQIFTRYLLELSLSRDYKLMREKDTRTVRKTRLRPRRLFDFISPGLMGLVAVVYIASVATIIYVVQIDDEWYESFGYIAMITAIYLLFAFMSYRHVHGKRLDPYQADEDRIRQTGLIVRVFVYSSMVVTLFITLSIALEFTEIRHPGPAVFSLYLQVMALIPFKTTKHIDELNFEVYREDTSSDKDAGLESGY